MTEPNISGLMNKIPLWLVFLPVSPVIILVHIMNKWRSHKLTGFNKHWNRTTFTIVLFTTLLAFCVCSPLLGFAHRSGSTLIVLATTYLCCVGISLFIREIEHLNAKKAYNSINK